VLSLLFNRYTQMVILFFIFMNLSSLRHYFTNLVSSEDRDLDNTRNTFRTAASNNSFRHENYKMGESKYYRNENPFFQGEGPTHRMRGSVAAAQSGARDASFYDRSHDRSGFM